MLKKTLFLLLILLCPASVLSDVRKLVPTSQGTDSSVCKNDSTVSKFTGIMSQDSDSEYVFNDVAVCNNATGKMNSHVDDFSATFTSIDSVRVRCEIRRVGAGAADIKVGIRVGTTDSLSALQATTTAYVFYTLTLTQWAGSASRT